jgi:hypothetical protein
MGFQPVGVYRNIGFKCGTWHDVAWWQLVLNAPGSEPEPPREFQTLRESSEWQEAIQAGLALLR